LKILGKRYDYRHGKLLSKAYGHFFTKKLKQLDVDFIVAPAASCEIAHISTSIPIIYITDGTFAGCLNYHKALSNLIPFSVRQGNEIEQLAIQKSKHVIVSSEWCAQSVKIDYQKNELSVLPYGANFDALPIANELQFEMPKLWKLLFVGVYWDNKGGDYVWNCFQRLLEKNYPVELTIVGCTPPAHVEHPNINIISFLDKNSVAGQQQLKQIYAAHHVLILPTRFDCTPIVINEASAFGMPCLVANSGGVAGHLKNGENGFLIDYQDTGKSYAEKIERFIQSPKEYLQLRKSTREVYDRELNWQHWTNKFKELLLHLSKYS
jgi:glycosyltransferase involved in cell wall biosynthesis